MGIYGYVDFFGGFFGMFWVLLYDFCRDVFCFGVDYFDFSISLREFVFIDSDVCFYWNGRGKEIFLFLFFLRIFF